MDSKWHYIWFCIIHRNFVFHKQISLLGNTSWNPFLDLCLLLHFDLLMTEVKKLYRNVKQGKIAGVCSGIADYFEIDPVLVRLFFILMIFWGGGVLAYIIAWFIVPPKIEI